METLKNSIFAKVIAFLVIQVCVVTIVFSGIVVVFNAGYGWYSTPEQTVKEDIQSEIAMGLDCEFHDGLYYDLEYNKRDKIEWPESLLKDYELPEGIGYKLEILDNKQRNLDDIKLQKNISLNKLQGTYEWDIYNDLYRLTIYVADPTEMGQPAAELFPKRMAVRYEYLSMIYANRIIAVAGLAAALAGLILLSVYLITSMKTETDKNNIIKKVPIDLALCIPACIVVLSCYVLDNGVSSSNYDLSALLIASMGCIVSVAVTSFVLFFVYRMKCGRWWSNTIVFLVLKCLKQIAAWCFTKAKVLFKLMASAVRKIPLVWKTVVAIIIVMFVNLVIVGNFYWSGFAQFSWVAGAVIVSVAVIYIALCMKRLQKGGQKLAEGDLTYKVETKGLFMDFADHAENLNRISDGMATAVEERIKSERFKAELITNVSHDIKTPLTSIINYVDLLKKENVEDEKVKEYIEVLDRQSIRLKKLTEDIVDASKASTGNVKIDLAPCKVGLLISQTIAEYKEKTEAKDLNIIMKFPEEELEILADGRRLWRVFDNLLNNICKYSQPGTRVYITLEESEGKAVVTYRNVSKYELDITADELMERFVRGDRSRNTEGSGLGLSIARNLVELQDGSFDITIDGDLFKVIIKFSLINL